MPEHRARHIGTPPGRRCAVARQWSGAAAIVLGILTAQPAAGHHGHAAYHVDREITVAGTVAEWQWIQPHTRIRLAVKTSGGRVEQWHAEGPPLSWAAQRGWTRSTLQVGERVSLVMYPSRQESHAGLVKRIHRATGETLVVSRPWLD